MKHFRHYLYGHCCHVFTDHEPLKSLLNTPHPSGKLAHWGLALQEADITIHYHPGKSNASADSLSHHPVGQLSMHDADTENSIVAATVGPEDTDEEEESSRKLSLVLSELEKSSCQVEVKHKRTAEFCVAAVAPELQEETQGGGRSIGDMQREDLELKLIIDFQEEGVLPSDDKKARELLVIE